MKKRLLMLLTVFMAVASVGWLQAQGTPPDNTATTEEANVTTEAELYNAVTSKAAKVTLANDITLSSAETQYGFNMNVEGMELDGAGHTITIGENFGKETTKTKVYPITTNALEADTKVNNQKIHDLTIDCAGHSNGLNIVNATGVQLNNVTIKNSLGAGLIVNSSSVTATGIHTAGNAWGGVNIDKGTPSFMFDATSTFAEPKKVWTELTTTDNIVHAPEGWTTSNVSEKEIVWTNSKLTFESWTSGKQHFINVFANGYPVVIKAAETQGQVVVQVDENDFVQIPSGQACIYGGSKDEEVRSTSVTMESGTVQRIYGGGSGSAADKSADVTGTASINVKGGKVDYVLCGGGNLFAKTNAAVIDLSKTTDVETNVACIYAGGFANPAQTSRVTTWEEVVCGTKNVTIKISEGVVLPEGLGCGGGQGYAYTGTSDVTINGATLGSFYGTLANGYADQIKAKISNTIFKPFAGYFDFCLINRGAVGSATIALEGCTFNMEKPESLKDSETVAVSNSLGAVQSWGGSDTCS